MNRLLEMASRVEAAAEVYATVKDFADADEWRVKFKVERVSTHLHGVSITLHFEIG